MIRYIIIYFLLFFPLSSYSQENKLTEIINDIAEEIAAEGDDSESAAVYMEYLYALSDNPVRINSSSAEEISRLFFLSDFQVKSLVDYTRSSGRIVSVYELANIPGFDRETSSMMIPFISFEDMAKKAPDHSGWRNTLLTNMSLKPSDNDTSALGSPLKILIKYRFTAGSFSGGFTTEKDSGERTLRGNPPLPDFMSANLAWTGSGILKKIVLGDFSSRCGPGTTINTGLRTGLSLTAAGYLSGGDEIRPYTSTGENNFYRGAATQLHIKKTDLMLFFSINKIDATVDSTDDKSVKYIESFYRSGLHNTSSSMGKKDIVTETSYGADLSYNLRNFRAGILWTANHFSLPVLIKDPAPEDIHDFEGDRNSNLSAYYKATLGKMILYGEISNCLSGKIALVQGVAARPADRLTLNILLRKYDPEFTAFHGQGPFSGSAGNNVNGIFGNLTFEAAKYLFISAGCDLRNYPWLRYRCNAPSMGKTKEIKVRYIPSERLSLEASYKYSYTEYNEQESAGIKKQEAITARTFKGIIKYSPFKAVTFSTRADFKISSPSGSKGTLLLQDMTCRFGKLPVSIWFRYCLFNTDDWESRIYTYENDLLYNFSIPALSGSGSRSYLLIDWRISRSADIRLKYAISELSDLQGNIEATEEYKLQLRLAF